MVNIGPNWRTPIRAALCVIITVSLSHFFPLEKGYWSTIMALLILSQSWGESINKGYLRVMMTIIGCSVGYAIYLLTAGIPYAHDIALLGALFGMVYCFSSSMAWMLFFVGVLVVFVFGSMIPITPQILWARLYETMIGAAVAIGVSGLLWPSFSRHSLRDELCGLLGNLKSILLPLMGNPNKAAKQSPPKQLAAFNQRFDAVRALHTQARYESWALFRRTKKMDQLMVTLEICQHYLTNLMPAWEAIQKQPKLMKCFETEISSLQQQLDLRFQQIPQQLKRQPVKVVQPWIEQHLEAVRAKLNQIRAKQSLPPKQIILLVSALYYARRIDDELFLLQSCFRH